MEIHADPSKADINGTGKRSKGLVGGSFGGAVAIHASVIWQLEELD